MGGPGESGELPGEPVADEPHTLGGWLTESAASRADRTAIEDGDETISYGRLEERAAALASSFLRAGYRPGDRLATVSANSIDHVVVFFACAKAGLVLVPLSWRLTAGELVAMLERTHAALLLADPEHLAVVDRVRHDLAVPPPIARMGAAGIEAAVPVPRRGTPPGPARAVRDDDPLLVVFTSGSEAAPKGVVLTHANCSWNNRALGEAMPLTGDDIVLAMLPQFHVAGWNVQPLLAWRAGATVVLERSFDPARILRVLEDRRITVMMGVPTQYRLLADAPGFSSADLASVRLALVGGAATPAALMAEWAARGVRLTPGYGLTEAGPNVLFLPADEAASRPGAVGRPYPSVDVRLAEPATGMALDGPATGELWVRGPSVFAGYLDDPAATARVMAGDWLRTGDLAARDADGVHRIVDRLKDIYVSGGENVAPAEVEAALCRHPLIREAAVVAVADRLWGERGVAFVVPCPDAELAAADVLAHARSQLASFKVPARVEIVGELPHSTIDKLARSRLRARAAALMEGES